MWSWACVFFLRFENIFKSCDVRTRSRDKTVPLSLILQYLSGMDKSLNVIWTRFCEVQIVQFNIRRIVSSPRLSAVVRGEETYHLMWWNLLQPFFLTYFRPYLSVSPFLSSKCPFIKFYRRKTFQDSRSLFTGFIETRTVPRGPKVLGQNWWTAVWWTLPVRSRSSQTASSSSGCRLTQWFSNFPNICTPTIP